MKLSKLSSLLLVPLFLASCGSDKPQPTPTPTPDPDPKDTIIDFKKMSFEEAKYFFSIHDQKVLNEEITMTIQGGIIENSTSTMKSVINISRDNSIYKILEGNGTKMSFPYADSIAFAKELLDYKGENVEEAIELIKTAFSEEEGYKFEIVDEIVIIDSGIDFDEAEYDVIYTDRPYGELYQYDSELGKYKHTQEFNLKWEDDETVTSFLPESKDYIYYDETSKSYKIDAKDIDFEEIEGIEKLEFTIDQKNEFKTLYISQTEYSEDEEILHFVVNVTVEDLKEHITLPEAYVCEHILSDYYIQGLSDFDGNYYHHKYCTKCWSDMDFEKCTFNEDGVCEVCKNYPTETKYPYLSPIEEDEIFQISVTINSYSQHILFSEMFTNLIPQEVDFSNCTFESISIEENVESVNLFKSEARNYAAIYTKTDDDLEKCYYLIGIEISEEDSKYVISGGTSYIYTEGETYIDEN